MHHLETTHIILAFLGMFIHMLMKIVSRRDKTEKFTLKSFFLDGMNYVRMILTLASTIALLYMLHDLALMFKVVLPDGSPAYSILAFLAGYSNHSLIRNILKLGKLFNRKES